MWNRGLSYPRYQNRLKAMKGSHTCECVCNVVAAVLRQTLTEWWYEMNLELFKVISPIRRQTIKSNEWKCSGVAPVYRRIEPLLAPAWDWTLDPRPPSTQAGNLATVPLSLVYKRETCLLIIFWRCFAATEHQGLCSHWKWMQGKTKNLLLHCLLEPAPMRWMKMATIRKFVLVMAADAEVLLSHHLREVNPVEEVLFLLILLLLLFLHLYTILQGLKIMCLQEICAVTTWLVKRIGLEDFFYQMKIRKMILPWLKKNPVLYAKHCKDYKDTSHKWSALAWKRKYVLNQAIYWWPGSTAWEPAGQADLEVFWW